MSSQWVEIQWSCSTIDEGRRVARYLVQERLVACAQIIPWIESVYMWNNQLETAQESKLILKSTRSHLNAIIQIILENSSYQVPEIIYHTIDGGNPAYLEWLEESVLKS